MSKSLLNTDLPRYLKVERFYENFHEQKWHEAKKQLTFIYMENFLSIPRPQN